ncbi:sugar transporter domain-containing protein [Phthorimaea operculella]|nr:sugar transporter domain-containing protein [Phthorimaea operculella]
MKDNKKPRDGAHEAMLKTEGCQPEIVSKKIAKNEAKAEEYEALQSFLRSISSTATLPPYVKGETYSSTRGVFNQCLITCAVLILAAGAGHPIGFSAVALPKLHNETDLTMRTDDEMDSWIVLIGLSAVALPKLHNEKDLTMRTDDEMDSWIASIHSAATPLGSMMSGPIMEAIGRRRTLQASTLPLVLGWILIGTASHHALLLLGRVVCGFAVGIMAAPSQVHILFSYIYLVKYNVVLR